MAGVGGGSGAELPPLDDGLGAPYGTAYAGDVTRSARGRSWRHVRTLLWLRGLLTFRDMTRGASAIVGVVVFLVFAVSFAVLMAVASVIGYLNLPDDGPRQLLYIVLAILYIGWSILPLLQYSLNAGLDVTKLQTYPISRSAQMVALVVSSVFDRTTIFLLAFYIAIGVAWHASPAALAVTVVALVLIYAHTVALSQLLLAALMGLLRDRRYRELVFVVFALSGVACALGGQAIGGLAPNFAQGGFPQIHLEQFIWWLPPGIAAGAISNAATGHLTRAIYGLGALAALLPIVLAVWGVALERGITSAASEGVATARRRGRVDRTATSGELAAPHSTAQRRSRPRFIPSAVAGLAVKDLRYYWRDPQLKIMFLGMLSLFIFIFLPSFGDNGSSISGLPVDVAAFQVISAPLPVVYLVLNLSMNALGLERKALQTLFIFPVSPRSIFWGKNLAIVIIALPLQVVVTVLFAWLTRAWSAVPLGITLGIAAMLVVMGCGNVSSVLVPFRVREMRMGRAQTGSDSGCLRGLLAFVVLGLSGVLVIPVIAAAIGPLLTNNASWLYWSLPAAIVYGVILYQLATLLIAPVLLSRAPDILAVTNPEE